MSVFDGLGGLLRSVRRRRELEVAELAERVGVAPRTLERYEAGTSLPDVETLGRLLEELNYDLVAVAVGLRTRRFLEPWVRPAAEERG